jgi:DNA-binding FadR family transcriptional regulator
MTFSYTVVMDASEAPDPLRILSIASRMPAARLGVAVVEGLVTAIVTGELQPGDVLPPEGPLAQQFGVSRTVLRESVKRVEEKGLVAVAQGRGTTVQPTSSWNMLDRVVLSALISRDDSLDVLDELTIVRARLESAMAAATARRRTDEQLDLMRAAIDRMSETVDDPEAFVPADVAFHELVMTFSGNRLAESIARILYDRARDSHRFNGEVQEQDLGRTLGEHAAVLTAIEQQNAEAAERDMEFLITEAWRRRRLPRGAGA